MKDNSLKKYVAHLTNCASRWPGERSMCNPPCEAFICPHIKSVPKPCDCGLSALMEGTK